jgi:hypothetical protein
MNLYEVTNGYEGASYFRVYVWAKDDAEADKLARASYDNDARFVGAPIETKFLLSSECHSLATKPSDEGWFR